MSKLTPYESARLQTLAAKAGITLPHTEAVNIKLRSKEIKKIEKALNKSAGKPIILIRKRLLVRVFSQDGYKDRIAQGQRLGKTRHSKETAHVVSTN
jgi:hypothetical protein